MKHTRTIKARATVGDNRRLTFYAAVFDQPATVSDPDGKGGVTTYREVIRPGAFAEALASNAEVIANIDHDPAQTFATRSTGELLLQEDPHGLFASCYLPAGEFGDSILSRVQGGELDGCSFRFTAVESRTEGDVVERLRVTLADVCLTASPAYPGTEVHLRNKNRATATRTKLRLLKLRGITLNNKNHGGT